MPINRTVIIRTGVVLTLAFALAHVYWAVGGTVGVPTGEPITDRPVFLAYDIVSALALFAAAAIGLRLVARPTPTLNRLTLIGASIALARGLVGVVQGGVMVANGDGLTTGSGYDAWFTVVGALFLWVALTGRTTAPRPVEHRTLQTR